MIANALFTPLLRIQHRSEPIGNAQETLQVFFSFLAPPDPQKIDDLNEQSRLAGAGFAHRFHQLPQSVQVAIVADTQQRPARHVLYTGRLDHDGARLPLRKTPVPIEHIRGDEARIVGSPRHHGRYPGALRQCAGPDRHRREQPRGVRLRCAGPAVGNGLVLDSLGRLPHGRTLIFFISTQTLYT
jgi:hypothetical protein